MSRAKWIGDDRELARDCRRLAAAGSAISTALLISDLGRSKCFLGMLRVFKPQSPMSVGAWTVMLSGASSAASAFGESLQRRSVRLPWAGLADLVEIVSDSQGMPFSNYTGVLIGATVIPVSNQIVETLPIHSGISGLNSAVAILELQGHTNNALNMLGIGASTIETLEGVDEQNKRIPAIEPLKKGRRGLITRIGGVLSGPIPWSCV